MRLEITWIIGNGFDVNLGLHTGYKYFVQNVYLAEDEGKYPPNKKRLIEAVGKSDGWNDSEDRWADLETLLGNARKLIVPMK